MGGEPLHCAILLAEQQVVNDPTRRLNRSSVELPYAATWDVADISSAEVFAYLKPSLQDAAVPLSEGLLESRSVQVYVMRRVDGLQDSLVTGQPITPPLGDGRQWGVIALHQPAHGGNLP